MIHKDTSDQLKQNGALSVVVRPVVREREGWEHRPCFPYCEQYIAGWKATVGFPDKTVYTQGSGPNAAVLEALRLYREIHK